MVERVRREWEGDWQGGVAHRVTEETVARIRAAYYVRYHGPAVNAQRNRRKKMRGKQRLLIH